tara:strand:+ start:38 stop:292 length:255 start_codon:yes stop_codon:yes gene_type:complete
MPYDIRKRNIFSMLYNRKLTVEEGLNILRREKPVALDVWELQGKAKEWADERNIPLSPHTTERQNALYNLERACGEYRGELGEY